MLRIVRINTWWNAIVPQVLAWVYFSLLCIQLYSNETGEASGYRIFYVFHDLVWFFVTLISLSCFGYLLNDFCDIQSDLKAGKSNRLAGLPVYLSVAMIAITLGVAILGWLRQFGDWAFTRKLIPSILFLLQLALLIAYSVKPFRLKERGIAGVIADALYGHLNPALITIFSLYGYHIFNSKGAFYKFSLLTLIIFLWFAKGVRNILLHQLEDRKRDRLSHTHTFASQHGALAILNFINRVLLPAELILLCLFVVMISYVIPPFMLSLILFLIISCLKFSGWKLSFQPYRQLKFKFLHFLNDYYEGWFPVSLLLIFSIYNHWALILLAVHLILFPPFISHLLADIETIAENFTTEEDY